MNEVNTIKIINEGGVIHYSPFIDLYLFSITKAS